MFDVFDETVYNKVLGELRAILARLKPGQDTYDEIIANRDQVFAKYRPIFSTDHVPNLAKEEFTSFLYFENNCHWSGLYRKGLLAAVDMDRLRKALGVLLDEGAPIQKRFPLALDTVAGLGKATATGILTVAYPDVYGVWNNTSEGALRKVGLWPSTDKGEGIGARYAKVNGLLARLRSDLGTDFWTLDALWWFLLSPQGWPALDSDVPAAQQVSGETLSHPGAAFALERQLEDFLLENWDRTPLAAEWAVYSTSEDPEAGNQFPTDVGPVDILAVHKKQPRLLVVELKRNQGTDQTVGQVLRYMGWVEKHLAKETGKTVEGLVIAHKVDKGASYALSLLPQVSMMTYEVEFRLKRWEALPD
jgi:hypothetical protein